MPSHYLNQCWNIVNWSLGNKLQWNFNRNSNIFSQEKAFENVVCEMASNFSWPQCVYRVGCGGMRGTYSLIVRFMGPTWGPSGADRTQVGPMLAPWTLLSGLFLFRFQFCCRHYWGWRNFIIFWETLEAITSNFPWYIYVCRKLFGGHVVDHGSRSPCYRNPKYFTMPQLKVENHSSNHYKTSPLG